MAIGDSIPFNSPQDCPGCTGFVDRYADAVSTATGQRVTVENLSEHTGLTLPGLLAEFGSLQTRLAAADVIVVGIAHNSFELSSDNPCGAPADADHLPDWSRVDAACAAASTAKYQPQFEKLFSQVSALREGKPTVLRTINRYNDLIGWPEGHLTPAQDRQTTVLLEAWNTMLCAAAEKVGFTCVDVYRAFNGPDGSTPSADLLAPDYTHHSDTGNAVISELLASTGFAPLA